MKIQEALKQLSEAREAINKYFDTTIYDLSDHTDDYWYYYGNGSDVKWWSEKPEDLDDSEYSAEIIGGNGVHAKKDYTVFYVNNGCGDQYHMLFDNSKRLRREDFGEE